MKRWEVLAWCLAGLVVVVAWIARLGGGYLVNDSYQYLSAAEHILREGRIATSIIHFDVERAAGTLPAPLTTFPPGYPILIAALALLGLPLVTAAVLISVASFVALIPLTLRAARALELTPNATRAVLAGLVGNAWATHYAGTALTEPLYAALSTWAVVLFMEHERRPDAPGARRALIGGAILVGLSYWVRYAGLFLLAGALAYYGARLAARRDRRSLVAAFALGLSGLLVGGGMLRNAILTGSWKGGNTKVVSKAALPLLSEFAVSVHHLLLGGGGAVGSRVGPLEVLFALAALAVVAIGLRARRAARSIPRAGEGALPPLLVVVAYLVVYSGGMIYLGLFSVISFGTRMFHPLLPLALLALAALLARAERALGARTGDRARLRAAVALLCVAYLLVNARTTASTPLPQPHAEVEARLAGPLPSGQPLRAWIDESVPRDAVVVAVDGPATAWVLQRRTVSLLEQEYSEASWDEAGVRAVMRAYGAEHLVLYPGAEPRKVPVQGESPFLAGLLRGEPPPWLALAADNGATKIFVVR